MAEALDTLEAKVRPARGRRQREAMAWNKAISHMWAPAIHVRCKPFASIEIHKIQNEDMYEVSDLQYSYSMRYDDILYWSIVLQDDNYYDTNIFYWYAMLSSHRQIENRIVGNWKVVPLQLLAFGHFHLVALNHVRAGILWVPKFSYLEHSADSIHSGNDGLRIT